MEPLMAKAEDRSKPESAPFICPICGKREVVVKETSSEEFEAGNSLDFPAVLHCTCTSCQQTVGLFSNDKFLSLEQLLTDAEGSRSHDSTQIWYPVESAEDRLALYTLSQIIYKEVDTPNENLLEFEFSLPPSTDISKLAWVEGSAVGFYTVKPQGTVNMETLEMYSMPTLDTIFIQATHRRKGLASAALKDFRRQFPAQDIGLSHPVSHNMLKVVEKHLEEVAGDRLELWEVSGCGGEGSRRNLWLRLHQKPKKKSR